MFHRIQYALFHIDTPSLDITLSEIIEILLSCLLVWKDVYENGNILFENENEILQNSGEYAQILDENLQNVLSPEKISKNCVEFC